MRDAHSECVFCQILAGTKYQPFVYQDALCTAFMDIDQPHPYHVLIIPNAHAENIYELRPDQAAAIFQASVLICRAIRDVSHCGGVNQFSNNGRAAGQSVYHFHLHVMPRFTGDRLKMGTWIIGHRSIKSSEVLDQMASDLKAKLTDKV